MFAGLISRVCNAEVVVEIDKGLQHLAKKDPSFSDVEWLNFAMLFQGSSKSKPHD